MRIGLVAPLWCSVPPAGYGGTGSVRDALARGVQELGHDVVLAATGDSVGDQVEGGDSRHAVDGAACCRRREVLPGTKVPGARGGAGARSRG